MGVIQSSINSAIQSAGYLSKLKGIEKNVQGLKETTKDIPGQIESLKTDKQTDYDFKQFVTNPNILKWKQAETDRAVQNALMKERMSKFKAQQSLTSQAEQKAKQKSDFKDLQLSIGGQKIDYNMLGENVKKQIDKEINNGK